MIILPNIEQGTPAWRQARAGKVTASRVADLMAKTKTGWGASRANYMSELICERLTGQPYDSGFTSTAMEWGRMQEPEARSLYELDRDVDVQQVGIVQHSDIADFLASPDGLVSDNGLIEIKAPNTATHISYLSGEIPQKYILQMQSQMACTDRAWCDFVSFDPRMPSEMTLLIKRVERNDKLISEIVSAVSEFLKELEDKVLRLRETYKKGDPNGKGTINRNTARHTDENSSGVGLVA